MARPTATLRAFASHDWGFDGSNHDRVRTVVDGLRTRGIDVWFDESHMKGNILDAMCRGIDTSDVVLVFVTTNYLTKVESGNERDNVRREFMYAKNRPEKLVPIRFDASLPSVWSGPVGMVLGSHLYTDLTMPTERGLDALVRTIQRHSGSTLWKHAVRVIRPPTAVTRRGGSTPRGAVVVSTRDDGASPRRPPRAPAPRPATPPAAPPATPPATPPAMPPATPRPAPLASPRTPSTMRERIRRAAERLGQTIRDGEHTHSLLDRMVVSLVGKVHDDMPFCGKLLLVEEHLGLGATKP